MTTVTIESDAHVIGGLPEFSRDVVKNEPMLFNCGFAAAMHLGGPITQAFLQTVVGQSEFSGSGPLIVDTRVQMLMKGWYPCIPGWHHDDVPRTRADGQPDYVTPKYRARHAMAMVGDPISCTEFAVGVGSFEIPPEGQVISGPLHEQCERAIERGDLLVHSMALGRVSYFDWQTWHRGVPATGPGWRWWGRVSANTERVPTNEVRRQTQVYLDATTLNAGW